MFSNLLASNESKKLPQRVTHYDNFAKGLDHVYSYIANYPEDSLDEVSTVKDSLVRQAQAGYYFRQQRRIINEDAHK